VIAHLPVLPVVLPLLAAAALLLLERRGIGVQRALGLAATVAQLGIALALAVRADSGEVSAYLLGNWEAWVGIALAVDRLAAIMLVTTATLGVAALLYACSGWDQRAPHFHALFQAQLMGLNGAFLTADLFNLFVFFEVLLIASYGLMLSGGRGQRMRAGVHYVAFNIAASTLYLFAIGLLYGLLGALNMAEMANRVAAAPAQDLALVQAAGGMLLVVFCAKAALFPLYLWLPDTYARTPAPVVALFAVMTKLGVYAVLRVYGTLFGVDAGELAGFAWPWVLWGGAIGLALAALGALAARSLRTLAGYLVVASAATLFIAVGLATPGTVGAGLYYLVQSSFAAAALFLLADTIRRQRQSAGDSLRKVDRIARRGLLGGLFFVAAVSIVGLPPLAGFIGKAALLAAVPESQAGWAWPLVLFTSLLALIALAGAGAHVFWRQDNDRPSDARPPQAVEYAAIGSLLALAVAMSLFAGPAIRYANDAALQASDPDAYRAALLQSAPLPSPSSGDERGEAAP
jgi:multicomponent K+:H+ antiporter subunit D